MAIRRRLSWPSALETGRTTPATTTAAVATGGAHRPTESGGLQLAIPVGQLDGNSMSAPGAGSVASEALAGIKTIMSLGGEIMSARRYEENLGAAQRDAVAHVRAHARRAEAPQHEPELERAEAAAQRQLPVLEVDHGAALAGRVAQVP